MYGYVKPTFTGAKKARATSAADIAALTLPEHAPTNSKRRKAMQSAQLVESVHDELLVLNKLEEVEAATNALLRQQQQQHIGYLGQRQERSVSGAKFRVLMWNEHRGQAASYHVGGASEAPCWTFRLSGRCLGSPQDDRSLGQLVSSLVIDVGHGARVVEWRPEAHLGHPAPGFEVTHQGTEPLEIKVHIQWLNSPPVYRLSEQLRRYLNFRPSTGQHTTICSQLLCAFVMQRLSEAMETPSGTQRAHGWFVKLSLRSAKDAVLKMPVIQLEIVKQLQRLHNNTSGFDDTMALRAFTRACGSSLAVNSAEQALDLLVHSQRIYDDLTRMALYHESDWSVQLVLRYFEDIEVDLEFRCFVYNHELTSATQYYSLCYVPEIAAQKDLIAANLQAYFKRIQPLLDPGLPDFTIDIVLNRDLSVFKVIEIGHPPPTAGTSLFIWPDDKDVLSKSGSFELRVLEQPVAQGITKIYPPLRVFLQMLNDEVSEEEGLWERHMSNKCDGCGVFPIYGPLVKHEGADWCHCCANGSHLTDAQRRQQRHTVSDPPAEPRPSSGFIKPASSEAHCNVQ